MLCLTSDVCLTSVAYIGPKSRTERPRKTKIGTEVAHVTRDSDTTFRVKRSKVKVTRPQWLAVQVIDMDRLTITRPTTPIGCCVFACCQRPGLISNIAEVMSM